MKRALDDGEVFAIAWFGGWLVHQPLYMCLMLWSMPGRHNGEDVFASAFLGALAAAIWPAFDVLLFTSTIAYFIFSATVGL